jgi:hypothetical protein
MAADVHGKEEVSEENYLERWKRTGKGRKRKISSLQGRGPARGSQRRIGEAEFRRLPDSKKRTMPSILGGSRRFFVQRRFWQQGEVDDELVLA